MNIKKKLNKTLSMVIWKAHQAKDNFRVGSNKLTGQRAFSIHTNYATNSVVDFSIVATNW